MQLSLNTEITAEGIVCTYADNGENAGIIRHQPESRWLACAAFGSGTSQLFNDLDAAEYHILAWAIEARAVAARKVAAAEDAALLLRI